jgi:hypothetical protein
MKGKLGRIIEHYGEENQHDKAIEELNELAVAIKDYMKRPTADNRFRMIDEIADVTVMLEQLKIMNVCRDEVTGRVLYKINRQIERMERE